MRGIVWAFKTSKPLLKEFFPLMAMVALQSLLLFGVNLVDNLMLGNYNEHAMAAVGIVNQVQFILQQFALGAGLGLAILCSRFWDNKQTNLIKKFAVISLVFCIAAGIIFCIVSLLCPHWVLTRFTNDPTLIEEGVQYLQIVCWSFIIYPISAALLYTLHAVKTSWVGMLTSGLAICINLVLDYIFIFGNFGAPELGIQGAGYATLASRSVELVIVLVYILAADKKIRFRIRDLFYFDRLCVPNYFRAAFPVLLSCTLLGIAQASQASILGHIGPPETAANSIALVIFQMFTAFGLAQSTAAEITMEKAFDTGKKFIVKNYAKALQLIFIGIGILTCALMLLTKGLIVSLYDLSPEAHRLALNFLTVLAIASLFSIYEYPVGAGIIAGAGKTSWQRWVDNILTWLMVLAAVICAFGLRLSPTFIYGVMHSSQVLKCIPNVIKCNRYRWARKLSDF